MSDPFDLTDEPGDEPAPTSGGMGPGAYLETLNDSQREAVEAVDGPVLVLAGAGTGKTRVLTTRLGHILMLGKARPGEILAVTFTNKAAREMQERVGAMLGTPVEGWWVGTFHALAARILRRHAEAVGLKPNFTILDTDDQVRLLKQILDARDIDPKRFPPRTFSAVIQRWKDRALMPDKVPSAEAIDALGGHAIEVYEDYQEQLRRLNAADFGDLLLLCVKLFQDQADTLKSYQRRFRYILVDEYQDTNVAQYLWLRLLAQGHHNICCVGDDDQCLGAGARVTMADGSRKPIEQVRTGDMVLSAYGSGDFRPARVTRIHKRARRGDLISLTTECGKRLVSTPEHIHFADYRADGLPDLHFVYLMHKDGVGYRLGVSSSHVAGQPRAIAGYKTRSVQEHADAVWVVSTHASENAARAEECILSLKYGLPTLPFTPRRGKGSGGLVHDAKHIARVFASLDTERAARDLMIEYGLSPTFPHHRPQGRDSNRHTVRLTLCGDRRGATPMHRISIAGNDPAVAGTLRGLGLSVRPARKDSSSWRVETATNDWGALAQTAARIAAAVPSALVRAARLGPGSRAREGNSLLFLPASSVRPGMSLFTADGGYVRIAKVEKVRVETSVHDLDVHPTHNFVAEGMVTHNSIYSWRGAEVGNILRFEQDFPGAQVVRLERNYRSTPHILGAASGLIARNEGRLGKTLWTDLNAGEKVRVHGVWDSIEEARWLCDEIEAAQRHGRRLADMAILVRTSAQTREFEERLITLGIPYQVIGGLRFYERQEIRDAVAYLRVIASPDDDLAFQRIANVPKRGLGDAAMQTIYMHARARGIPLLAAIRELIGTDEFKPRPRAVLTDLSVAFERWRAEAQTRTPAMLMDLVLEESGYLEMWKLDKSIEAPGRVDNLKELVVGLSEFDSLTSFLEHVSLVMDNEDLNAADKVTVMTLHGAKGLEFDTVFLPGWEEGLFPHQRAMDESGVAGLEEERRLAYVGLTRARKMAFVTFAANRRTFGQWQSSLPSRFVDELPPEHVERDGAPGVSSGAARREAQEAAALAKAGYGAGWARAQARRAQADTVFAPARMTQSGLTLGQRVFHQKFGYGRIVALDGDKLDIDFEKAGAKKVMASFVEPA